MLPDILYIPVLKNAIGLIKKNVKKEGRRAKQGRHRARGVWNQSYLAFVLSALFRLRRVRENGEKNMQIVNVK